LGLPFLDFSVKLSSLIAVRKDEWMVRSPPKATYPFIFFAVCTFWICNGICHLNVLRVGGKISNNS